MTKKLFLSLLISISLFASSCVSFVPLFNAAIVNDVTQLGQKVDAMYITMEQSSNKSYSNYIAEYANSESLINSIIVRNETRPKAGIIVKQSVIYRDLFLKYQGEHKAKVTLSNAEIRIYNQYLKDALKPLLVSEMSLK